MHTKPRAKAVLRSPLAHLRLLRATLLVATLACVLAPELRAQAPKVGKYFEDTTDLGFKVKVPLEWEFIPPAPDDGNLIGKFDPKSNKTVLVGGKNLSLSAWLLKFDRRKSDAESAPKGTKRKFVQRAKDMPEWLEQNINLKFQLDGKPGDVQLDKVSATEYEFTSGDDKEQIRVYAMVYRLQPDVDIALAFIGPGKQWTGKYAGPCEEMARSFKALELKASASAKPTLAGASYRDRKRAEVQERLRREPDWKFYETENYFILSNQDDKEFIDELMGRLEAIRAIYAVDYPLAKALELRENAPKTGSGAAAKPKPPVETTEPKKSEPPAVDPQEVARTTIVRVCKTEEQYHSYGGPARSAGYWNSNAEELVLYVDKNGGIRNTWKVLNHEAFHQYIYYFYGSIAPQSWYNEGTGDFYSGYEYGKNKKFTLKPFDWRVPIIKTALQRSGEYGSGKKYYVPLQELVHMTQPEYYTQQKTVWETDVSEHYAEGWSFIYFLRTGKKNGARGWNARWDTILDTYLEVLATSGKTEQAVTQAFQGVDFDELERAWFEYTR